MLYCLERLANDDPSFFKTVHNDIKIMNVYTVIVYDLP